MKRLMILLALCLTTTGFLSAKPHMKIKAHADFGVGVSFFYSSLSPYGEWVESDFGYAWRPIRVNHGWRPYMYGQWVWSDYGWYWVSNEPFGWATFHYGRWTYDDYYGWIWIPDNVWGPSWVEWRYDDSYIGWAPLPPYATFSMNFGITYTSRWYAPVHYWNFVPCRYFTTSHVVDYVQPVERSRRIFGNTRTGLDIRSEDHRVVNRGIDVDFVQRRTNTHIREVEVTSGDRSGGERLIRESNRERIEAYRPHIENPSSRDNAVPPELRRRNDDNRPVRTEERNASRNPAYQKNPTREREFNTSPRQERNDDHTRYQMEQHRESNRESLQNNQKEPEQQNRRDAYERRQEMQRERQQQRQDQSRSFQEQRNKNNPRIEREQQRQPKVQQERPQPSQRSEPTRGGREGRRRP